jgi:hypothetical protein
MTFGKISDIERRRKTTSSFEAEHLPTWFGRKWPRDSEAFPTTPDFPLLCTLSLSLETRAGLDRKMEARFVPHHDGRYE